MSAMTFPNTGADFSAAYDAEKWCRQSGYSFGPMCGLDPIAIMRGDVQIAKWKNLTKKERAAAHGTIKSDDFRHGPVVITIKEESP